MPSISENRETINHLLTTYTDQLSTWELSFLNSIARRLHQMVPLSEKQQAVLDKLEQEMCKDEDDDNPVDDIPF